MIKNSKGYLLAETIIAITVVATVITMVYAIIMNYYIKEDNEITKFNTAQGIYNAYQIKKLFSDQEKYYIESFSEENKDYVQITDFDSAIKDELNIKEIFYSKKNIENLIKDENISIRLKKFLSEYNDNNTYNLCEYKYIVIYNDDSYSIVGSECDE
ncbi:MAG: hypothetical protein IJ105_02235 [Bacilli bacterium]|nr:hypothetical protein [Bacilli bacterium]